MTPEVDAIILPSFKLICREAGLSLRAANSAWDHVHLLIGWNQTASIADVVRTLKSKSIISYHELWERQPELPPPPRWQRGYSAFSTDYRDLTPLLRYIRDQKRHHRRPHTLICSWEHSDDDEE